MIYWDTMLKSDLGHSSTELGSLPARPARFPPRLPARIARIYPAWRDYDYVMVRDRILIIDPVDRRIVAVLES